MAPELSAAVKQRPVSHLVLLKDAEVRKAAMAQMINTSNERNDGNTNPAAVEGPATTEDLKTAARCSAGDPRCLKVREKCFFQEANGKYRVGKLTRGRFSFARGK